MSLKDMDTLLETETKKKKTAKTDVKCVLPMCLYFPVLHLVFNAFEFVA